MTIQLLQNSVVSYILQSPGCNPGIGVFKPFGLGLNLHNINFNINFNPNLNLNFTNFAPLKTP